MTGVGTGLIIRLCECRYPGITGGLCLWGRITTGGGLAVREVLEVQEDPADLAAEASADLEAGDTPAAVSAAEASAVAAVAADRKCNASSFQMAHFLCKYENSPDIRGV
jgi:hypothetical protein